MDITTQIKENNTLTTEPQLINRSSISPLETLIGKANKILYLSYDWDDEGALPINKEIFGISIAFLREYYYFVVKNYNQISLPEIAPCPDGSIDLDWHTPNAQLLINISLDKENGEHIAHYYGDKHNNKVQIKGSTPTNEFSEHLAVWMKYLN